MFGGFIHYSPSQTSKGLEIPTNLKVYLVLSVLSANSEQKPIYYLLFIEITKIIKQF